MYGVAPDKAQGLALTASDLLLTIETSPEKEHLILSQVPEFFGCI
jgi:hypothetical protein